MRTGDVVMTRSIEVRSSFDKRAMRSTFKANPGKAMVFLALGGVASDEELNGRAEMVLRAIGWIPNNDAAALRAALSSIEAELLSPQGAADTDGGVA